MAAGRGIGAIAAGAFALALAFAQPAVAQPAPVAAGTSAAARAAAANPEYQALFRRMYADPSNLDVTFKFAEVAARLGDYEAAIGALERMLYYNPNLPRVKLELGVLYHRIGGYKVSRSYFEQALATPGAPADVRQRVAQFMTDIDQRLTQHKYSGFVHAGYRYQSNASAGPNDLTVRALGNDATLDSKFAQTADWNKFATGGFGYTYEYSDALYFEATAIGYYAKQEKLSQFDLGIAEVQVGPRIAVPLINGSLKLYGIGTYAMLAGDPYYKGPGAGASVRYTFGNFARFETSYEFRDRHYENSVDYPTAENLTGKLHTLATTAEGSFGFLPWSIRVAGDWNRTDRTLDPFNSNSYDRFSANIAFPFAFQIPRIDIQRQAVFTPAAGISRTRYLAPDPLIDPDVARLDKEWHVSGALDVQVYEKFGFRTQVYYTNTKSSLPNFATKNLAVSLGPTMRF